MHRVLSAKYYEINKYNSQLVIMHAYEYLSRMSTVDEITSL